MSPGFSYQDFTHLVIQRILHRLASVYTSNLVTFHLPSVGAGHWGTHVWHDTASGSAPSCHFDVSARELGKNFWKSSTLGAVAITQLCLQVAENHIDRCHWPKLKRPPSLPSLSNTPKCSGRDKVTWPQAKSERKDSALNWLRLKHHFENFTKTYNHVNTKLETLPHPWNGPRKWGPLMLKLYECHGSRASACWPLCHPCAEAGWQAAESALNVKHKMDHAIL